MGTVDLRSCSVRLGVGLRPAQAVDEGCATVAAARLHRPGLPADVQVLEAGRREETDVPGVGGRLHQDVERRSQVSDGRRRRHRELLAL